MEFCCKESVFLELLQIAIWNKQPDLDTFKELKLEDWEEIFTFSVKQGIQAIIFDGIVRLPEKIQPSRNLKLKWIVNVDSIERRFERYLNTCAELVQLYAKNNIKVMLLKGIGLADQYPEPRHRECGDIDIWLFGDYKRGNEVIKKQGIKMDHADQKHLLFYFQNIPIENHRTFSNEHRYKADLILEAALNEIIKREKCEMVALPQNTSAFTPPPTFNAIFLARHMIVHLVNGICVRHLCDWAIFLQRNQGKYDSQYVIEAFRKAGMLELVSAFSSICVKYIGLPKECNPFVSTEISELSETIFTDILRRSVYEINTLNPFKILIHKWKRFYSYRWRYKLAHGISTPKVIYAYLKIHITSPFDIFRA